VSYLHTNVEHSEIQVVHTGSVLHTYQGAMNIPCWAM